MLHVLQWKSWRQAAMALNIPHTVLYSFYRELVESWNINEIIQYMIMRRIALYVSDEKHITSEFLQSDEIVTMSLTLYNT